MKIGDRVKTKDGDGTVEKVEGHNILIKLDSGVFARCGIDQVEVIEKEKTKK